jgi:hypothetical protein
MKSKYLFLLIIFSGLFLMISCEFGIEDETINEIMTSISGQVVDSESGNAVIGASVKINNSSSLTGATTNSQGMFFAEFELIEDQELTIIIQQNNYHPDTIKIFVNSGSSTTLPLVRLTAISGTGSGTSGQAASLYLYSQSAQSIGVKESGSIESVQIIFEVLDSSGIPITIENKVFVRFSFLSNPGGGEYLYPDSIETNSLGRATVTLNSGTAAGVVQVIAGINNQGNAIQSRPVMLAIYGGLPDQDHFDVASDKLNYPEYGIIGFEIPFTAYVGDKYSNPVRPGTSVYYSTTSGIIGGSAQTDNLGRATVTLLTQPFPDHPVYGAGFFEVTASTIDENNNNIQTSTIRLLSGAPQINVNPTTFNIPNGGSQFFTYTISDVNGNPLAGGTTISVSVTEGELDLSGDIDISLPDTQSQFYTNFSFTAYDAEPGTEEPQNVIITIQTSGPNGNQSLDIFGTSR